MEKGGRGQRSLTLVWHNQRELLHHGCQQLHHGLDVLGAEGGNHKCQVFHQKVLTTAAIRTNCAAEVTPIISSCAGFFLLDEVLC